MYWCVCRCATVRTPPHCSGRRRPGSRSQCRAGCWRSQVPTSSSHRAHPIRRGPPIIPARAAAHRARPLMLVKTISSFTVAHSLTLAIATLGYGPCARPPLTAAIALSILFLGPEIVRSQRGETSLTLRHRGWSCLRASARFGFASGPPPWAATGRDPSGVAPLPTLRTHDLRA